MAASSRDLVAITVAELVGMLSLAADLGLGQPMEHLTRSCLIATRRARVTYLGLEMGVSDCSPLRRRRYAGTRLVHAVPGCEKLGSVV
jgi:hypothetical protein